MFVDLRERKGGRGSERNINVRQKPIGCLLYAPRPGTEPTTQVGTLTRNRTHNPLVYEMMLLPTEPPGQGSTVLNFEQPCA